MNARYWHRLVRPALGRDMHRPVDRAAMGAAVRDLTARGLQPRDVAEALEITEHAVRQLLEERRP